MNALFSFWKKSFVVGELFIASALSGLVGAQDTSDQTAVEPEPIDVINSVTYDLGDHLVEFQEVTEVTIPSPPPETQATAPQALTPVQQAQFEAWKAEQPASKSLAVAGAVYCSSNHPPRTLVQLYPQYSAEPILFWSSIDWRLFRGGRFTLADGTAVSILVLLSTIDEDQTKAVYAANGGTYIPPVIPAFPSDRSSYQIVSGAITQDQRSDLDALHALHDSSYAQLIEAEKLRQQNARQAEEEASAREAQPPPDVVFRYRVMTPEELESISSKIKRPAPTGK